MKHLHFDVETAGFYGAYWACAGGSDCAVIAMIGDDPEDRLARSAAKWLCGRGVNVLTMSPAKKDYGHPALRFRPLIQLTIVLQFQVGHAIALGTIEMGVLHGLSIIALYWEMEEFQLPLLRQQL